MSQAELSVLGAAMISRRALDELTSILTPDDFETWQNETIWRAISSLAGSAQGVDPITVADELLRMGDLERIGGAAVLHELTSAVPTAANAGYYAEIVKADALRRRLQEAAAEISTLAGAPGEPEDLGETARAVIDRATQKGIRDSAPIGDDLDEMLVRLAEKPLYVTTPWRDLNDLMNGWAPGGLYVIGARPGSGKTIMGLQAAAHLAAEGPVAFSSLEMPQEDLTKRLFAMRAGIHMSLLSRNSLGPLQWEKVREHQGEIRKMPLFIDDRSHVTVGQIRAHARNVLRRHGSLRAVVVDYLQLISSSDPRRPRHEIVGEISRSLKIMARELNVPVIALCQLNRNSEGGQRPGLSDLRESGTIEQDADVVILLQRETDPDGHPLDELYVGVAKNRQGKIGHISLVWEGEFARVMNWGESSWD